MCVVYLHHRMFWYWSYGLEVVSHFLKAARNIFFKQYGEVSPFCQPLSLVNPAGNIPEQHIQNVNTPAVVPVSMLSFLHCHWGKNQS